MPTTAYSHPWDVNPRLWCALRRKVEVDMIAAGWNRHARKFSEVALRKTRQAWSRTQ